MSFQDYLNLTKEEVLAALKAPEAGLSTQEVARRQRQFGLNILTTAQKHWWQILLAQFKSAFIYLLIAAGIFFLILGENINAIMILLFVSLNAFLGFYQEYRSEKSLKMLRKYLVASSRVRRGGEIISLPSHDIVPGDIIILAAGDIVPADIRILDSDNLTIDESILTGESMPTQKKSEPQSGIKADIYSAKNLAFSGTTIVSGSATGVVYATGGKTQFGGIADLSAQTTRESSFEKNVRQLSKFVLRLILVTLVFVFLANLLIKGDTINIFELLVFSLALAVSVIPEALPVVTTFSLTRGALHLAKNKVVVKRLSSIEDLGSLEVLCTDKTGTITENKLQVADFYAADKKQLLIEACLGASQIFKTNTKAASNSFDLAIWQALEAQDRKSVERAAHLDELAFDPQRKLSSVVIKDVSSSRLIVRGAPEKILELSNNLTTAKKQQIKKWFAAQGLQGRRILAIATRSLPAKIPDNLAAFEKDLNFFGLISFVDPIKKTTADTITRAKTLGVKIKILTGDSLEVAGAVATEIGLCDSAGDVMSGEAFDNLSHVKKHQAVETYNVFARVSPQQKFEIIKFLREKHEVGFLGEGINDAPALKLANVGLVVSGASDVARESADIILLNKSLEVIINGIREGRAVFANTVKYVKATLGSNFGNFFAIAAASLIIDFLPMLPLQILLLNLLSDSPMIAIATDNIEPQELRKPRSYNLKEITLASIIFGSLSSIFDFTCFALFFKFGPQVLQTNWFIESILTELVFLFAIRSRLSFFRAKSPSKCLLILTVAAIAITIALPFIPLAQEIFKFAAPQANHLIYILILVVVYFAITEIVKSFYYRYLNGSKSSPQAR